MRAKRLSGSNYVSQKTYTWLGPFAVENHVTAPIKMATASTQIVVQPDMVVCAPDTGVSRDGNGPPLHCGGWT